MQEAIERPITSSRVHLLCNAGYRGSGKTILQGFNCFWFVSETKALAIDITFNDDQYDLIRGKGTLMLTEEDFNVAVAIRILHRLVMYFYRNERDGGLEFANGELNRNGTLAQLVLELKSPLDSILKVVRAYFGNPDLKILLAVDELAKAASATMLASDMMSRLTAIMDRDNQLVLSVSAYGALDLSKFATNSNRPILLQSLGPIFSVSGFTASVEILPKVMMPFYNSCLRMTLRNEARDLELYSRLSRLISYSGGHPRRVEVLLNQLAHII